MKIENEHGLFFWEEEREGSRVKDNFPPSFPLSLSPSFPSFLPCFFKVEKPLSRGTGRAEKSLQGWGWGEQDQREMVLDAARF